MNIVDFRTQEVSLELRLVCKKLEMNQKGARRSGEQAKREETEQEATKGASIRFKQVRRIAVEASMKSKYVIEEPLVARKELPSFGEFSVS